MAIFRCIGPEESTVSRLVRRLDSLPPACVNGSTEGRMMRRLILALAIAAAASPSVAQKAEVVLWKDVRNWSVYVDRTIGDTCFASAIFDDGTSFRFGFLQPGSELAMYVAIGNANWRSIESGKDYELFLQLDNEPLWRSPARASLIGGVPYLVIGTNEIGFVEELMRKHSLRVHYEGRTILNLSLQGSHAAVREMVVCESTISEYRPSGPATGGDPFSSERASEKADPFAQ